MDIAQCSFSSCVPIVSQRYMPTSLHIFWPGRSWRLSVKVSSMDISLLGNYRTSTDLEVIEPVVHRGEIPRHLRVQQIRAMALIKSSRICEHSDVEHAGGTREHADGTIFNTKSSWFPTMMALVLCWSHLDCAFGDEPL